jgi:hypothetical protein
VRGGRELHGTGNFERGGVPTRIGPQDEGVDLRAVPEWDIVASWLDASQ